MSRELLIHGVIRRGGTAEILEAEETQAGGVRRRVVVKRLRPELEDECGPAFLDEARLLAQLAHPGVVRLLGTERLDGRIVQILEPIDGRTLGEWTGDGARPLPRSAALYVVAQLARTLAHVHEAKGLDGGQLGIVHRDLSPDNVMIARSGEVKLLDFGIARAWRRQAETRVGEVKGTGGFLAPEQWRGGRVDPRTDLYALGLLTWFALEGRSPTRDPARWERVLAGESLVPPAAWPEGLRQLVAHLLQAEVERRPRSAAGVAQTLSSLLAREREPDGAAALSAWLSGLDGKGVPGLGRGGGHPLEALFGFGAPEASSGGEGAGTHRLLELDPADVVRTQAAESTWVTWEGSSETLEPTASGFEGTPTLPTQDDLRPGPPTAPWPSVSPPDRGSSELDGSRPSFAPDPSDTHERLGGSGARARTQRALALRLALLALVTLGGLCLGLWLPPLWSRAASPPASRLAPVGQRSPPRPEPPPEGVGTVPVVSTASVTEVGEIHGVEEGEAAEGEADEAEPLDRTEAARANAGRSPRRVPRRGEGRASAVAPRGDPALESARFEPARPESESGADSVRGSLERLALEIRRARGEISPDALRAFESRYFDLRTEFRPGLSASEAATLESRIQAELRSLAAVRRAEGP